MKIAKNRSIFNEITILRFFGFFLKFILSYVRRDKCLKPTKANAYMNECR